MGRCGARNRYGASPLANLRAQPWLCQRPRRWSRRQSWHPARPLGRSSGNSNAHRSGALLRLSAFTSAPISTIRATTQRGYRHAASGTDVGQRNMILARSAASRRLGTFFTDYASGSVIPWGRILAKLERNRAIGANSVWHEVSENDLEPIDRHCTKQCVALIDEVQYRPNNKGNEKRTARHAIRERATTYEPQCRHPSPSLRSISRRTDDFW